jgi:hypothetical protein
MTSTGKRDLIEAIAEMHPEAVASGVSQAAALTSSPGVAAKPVEASLLD